MNGQANVNFFNNQNHRLNLIRNMPDDANKERALLDFIDLEETRLRRTDNQLLRSPWLDRANRMLNALERVLYDDYLNDDDTVRRMLF